MNDTKATNRIKAEVLRQLMEMKLPEHRPVPVVEPEEPEIDKWEDYDVVEGEYQDDYWEREKADEYLREREEAYRLQREEEIERMIQASEDAREYLRTIEEFNANISTAVTAAVPSTGDDL